MIRKCLLVCGVLSSLLYVATDALGAMRWEGYRYVSQTVSELSAIGAPTRPLVAALFLAYSVLVIAFGFGVRESAGRQRALRITGGLLIGFGILCLTGPFTPMHQRPVLAAGGRTFTDTLHIVGTMVDVLFILLIVGFGATAFGKRFRLYSIATIVILLAFGGLVGIDAPRIQANLPTPWVGVTERISIFGSLLWMAVLSIRLLRVRDTVAADGFVRPAGSKIAGGSRDAGRGTPAAT